MNTLMLIQENIQPSIKLFPQLGDGRNWKDENQSVLVYFRPLHTSVSSIHPHPREPLSLTRHSQRMQ